MGHLSEILNIAIPSFIRGGEGIYQDRFAGTKKSDLFYPVVQQVYGVWDSLTFQGPITSNWAQYVGKGSILSGAIFLGGIKGKKISLILAEVARTEILSLVVKGCDEYCFPGDKKKRTPERKRHVLVALVISYAISNVLCIYLKSKRNSMLPTKPYYFTVVAYPLLQGLRIYYLDHYINPKLASIVGHEKDRNGQRKRAFIANEAITELVMVPVIAKCASLATGESVKVNWSAHVISAGMARVTEMYL